MSFESRLKTGITYGLTAVALTSGSIYESQSIGQSFTKVHYDKTALTTFTSSQTKGSSVNIFSDIRNVDTHEKIIEHALNQINNFNFIEVDDEIDREIDAFFANRGLKKKKKILYKRV